MTLLLLLVFGKKAIFQFCLQNDEEFKKSDVSVHYLSSENKRVGMKKTGR